MSDLQQRGNTLTVEPEQAGDSGKQRNRNMMRWATKGGLAIIDQALISGSNFLVGILLARWLVPETYGAYALAFSVFLLLSFVSQALLFEPMAVFSGSQYQKSMRGYFRSVLWIHTAMT